MRVYFYKWFPLLNEEREVYVFSSLTSAVYKRNLFLIPKKMTLKEKEYKIITVFYDNIFFSWAWGRGFCVLYVLKSTETRSYKSFVLIHRCLT